jgi:hypothetical protein
MMEDKEILVTPEMIKAGAAILRDLTDMGPYSARGLAEEVFRAMIKAKTTY